MEENWKVLRPIGGDGDEDQKLCTQMQIGPASVTSHRLTHISINIQQVNKNTKTC